jgi:hypothetical protein
VTSSPTFTGERTARSLERPLLVEETVAVLGLAGVLPSCARVERHVEAKIIENLDGAVLDARPVRKDDSRLETVEDLLDSAQDLVFVDVLMGREFDSQPVLEEISQRGLSYVVPKQMQTSEKVRKTVAPVG